MKNTHLYLKTYFQCERKLYHQTLPTKNIPQREIPQRAIKYA